MNEHLNTTVNRQTEVRNGSEQVHAAEAQRERAKAPRDKCGLDTGSRGWRYVYQTH